MSQQENTKFSMKFSWVNKVVIFTPTADSVKKNQMHVKSQSGQ